MAEEPLEKLEEGLFIEGVEVEVDGVEVEPLFLSKTHLSRYIIKPSSY